MSGASQRTGDSGDLLRQILASVQRLESAADPGRLLSDQEAAALLGVSRSKFRELVASGQAHRGYRVGRCRRWKRSDVLKAARPA